MCFVISVHESPPSVLLNSPEPLPPDTSIHGLRCICQKPAYSTFGLLGSIARSAAPVESSRKSTFVQFFPPSLVRNTPRSAFGPQACPCADTYATSGLVGCTNTREICRVSFKPMFVQLRPPSVVFHTPSPCDTLPRIVNSPPPTYTTSGLLGATPMLPIVPPKYLSLIGTHVLPPSTVLKTPEPVVPIQYSLGRATLPATAAERPPR